MPNYEKEKLAAIKAVQDGDYSRNEVSEEDFKKGEEKAKYLGHMAKVFREMLALVKDVVAGKYKLKNTDLAIFIGGIIYVIVPTDILPDWLPVIGWIDDIAVISWIANTYQSVIADWRQWKNRRKSPASYTKRR